MRINMIVLLLVGLLSSSAMADVVTDQEYIAPYATGWILDYPSDYEAQTFTVNNSGQLVGVGVEVYRSWASYMQPVTDDLYLRLVRTDSAGVPVVGDVLASRTIDRNAVPRWGQSLAMLDVDLSDSDIHVEAGNMLAIVLNSNHTTSFEANYYSYEQYVWGSYIPDPVPSGNSYVYSLPQYGPLPILKTFNGQLEDFGFRVLINTPEPPSFLFGIIGFLWIGFSRRRRFAVGLRVY